MRKPKKTRDSKQKAGSTNICAVCQRNIAECVWLTSGAKTPVPGWTAEPSCVESYHDNNTYHITACPLYIPPAKKRMEPEPQPPHKTRKTSFTGVCYFCGKPLTGGQRKYCLDCRAKYGNRFSSDYDAMKKKKERDRRDA